MFELEHLEKVRSYHIAMLDREDDYLRQHVEAINSHKISIAEGQEAMARHQKILDDLLDVNPNGHPLAKRMNLV